MFHNVIYITQKSALDMLFSVALVIPGCA